MSTHKQRENINLSQFLLVSQTGPANDDVRSSSAPLASAPAQVGVNQLRSHNTMPSAVGKWGILEEFNHLLIVGHFVPKIAFPNFPVPIS